MVTANGNELFAVTSAEDGAMLYRRLAGTLININFSLLDTVIEYFSLPQDGFVMQSSQYSGINFMRHMIVITC